MLEKLLLKSLSKQPVSRSFGFDRGLPIDRYYIESFLEENKQLITGTVLEIADSTYTSKFGGQKVRKALVLHATPDQPNADLVGDLSTGEGIPENAVDCFILTQTLPFIFDVNNAVRNAVKILRPGGSLLVTVSGITQISRYDMDRWGHYWSFTDLSVKRLFEQVVPANNIHVQTYGNAKAAACFLYGLAQCDLTKRDLDYRDKDYQLIITAVVKKPE